MHDDVEHHCSYIGSVVMYSITATVAQLIQLLYNVQTHLYV